MCSGYLQDELEKVLPASVPSNVTRWTSVGIASVTSTYLSHGLHTLATAMQANQNLTYKDVVPRVYKRHGMSFMWTGVQGRIALLLATNLFNEQFLKPVWRAPPGTVREMPTVDYDVLGLMRTMSTASLNTLFRLQHHTRTTSSSTASASPPFRLRSTSIRCASSTRLGPAQRCRGRKWLRCCTRNS